MWIPYNPNPQKLLVGDCTIRAICAATDRDWTTVHREVCGLSEEMADMPSSNRVWWEHLAQRGFTRRRLIDYCPDCYTVADFAADHPHGIYLLGPPEHVVTVIDGDWFDTFDSGLTIPTYYLRRK